MPDIRAVDLFCEVVDNFGDIGVTWRLARQLATELCLDVTLWVDDLHSFNRICGAVDVTRVAQRIDGVDVFRWSEDAELARKPVGDLVIEAFGCRLPDVILHRMATRTAKPVWLNLEYLSAEAWIDGCHTMASPHPQFPLTKYFFFPGFTEASGGLLLEHGLQTERNEFQHDPVAKASFLEDLVGVRLDREAICVSLFCYQNAPAESLFDTWQRGGQPVSCIVPEGVATAAVQAFLQCNRGGGAHERRGNLSLHVVPFVEQSAYDRLLWACDFNFVRGEDSFVRAQWAQRPFIWQIYPQEEKAHLVKLDAFLDRYVGGMSSELAALVRSTWHGWNERGTLDWNSLQTARRALDGHAGRWAQALSCRRDLCTNIIEFARKIG